uniref:Uncharacterized protein n=1 Tax=Heterorhabditis bacteriophora TaxID=37862 RepID=A0A1I7XB82_HETBA
MPWDDEFGRLRTMAFLGKGFASVLSGAGPLAQCSLSQLPFGRRFLRASKALRKPLTTSGWTRLELPSGKGR